MSTRNGRRAASRAPSIRWAVHAEDVSPSRSMLVSDDDRAAASRCGSRRLPAGDRGSSPAAVCKAATVEQLAISQITDAHAAARAGCPDARRRLATLLDEDSLVEYGPLAGRT